MLLNDKVSFKMQWTQFEELQINGWSHFAQFTIAVVNKDPKKSKYSDTLHGFWKKEHDWGWKKFMELSKVLDGFIDADATLIIKAQVQVIRFLATLMI
ncbi:putative MATH/TRAF domain-containing protein [Helianthus anomalus]